MLSGEEEKKKRGEKSLRDKQRASEQSGDIQGPKQAGHRRHAEARVM